MIFGKALLAGLAISAPMGPINMVCIKQTIRLGFAGFIVVAAAAGIANITLSGLAATGSVALMNYLTEYATVLHGIGGCILIGYGILELLSSVKEQSLDYAQEQKLSSVFLQVISIGLSNPMTILGYMSLMMELAGDFHHPGLVLSVVFGLTISSVCWRLCLGAFVLRMKNKYVVDYLRYIKILCPLCFFYFGACSLQRVAASLWL